MSEFQKQQRHKIGKNSELPAIQQPKKNLALDIILQFLGGIGILLAAIIFFYINVANIKIPWAGTFVLNLVMSIIAVGSYFSISRGRQLAADPAKNVMLKDSRSPIVYLRSFKDDQPFTFGNLSWLGVPGVTEEQVVAKIMSKFGPFVAIGRPGERLPTLGAARTYVNDHEWRDKIDDMINRAALVVLRTGDTDGFWWEVKRVCEIADPERVLFFLGSTPTKQNVSTAESEYLMFKKRAEQYLPKPLPENLDGASFIAFSKNWTPYLLAVQGSSGASNEKDRYAACLFPLFDSLGFKVPKPRRLFRFIIFSLLLGLLAYVALLVIIEML